MYTTNIPKRVKIYAYTYGLILSSALTIGKILYNTNSITNFFSKNNNLIISIVSITSFTAILGSIISIVFMHLTKTQHYPITFSSKKRQSLVFLILWVLIFISWIPAFLAYYPGIFSYDISMQTCQAVGQTSYTRFHPPLHTFIWSLCLKLRNITGIAAIIIYSLLQMLFLSSALAKMISFFIQRSTKNRLIMLSIIFVSLNPVIAIFSMIPVKDVYFAGFFVLTIISLCNLISISRQNILSCPIKWVPFVIFASFTCLLRNNAVYAFILFLLVIFILFPKYRSNNCIIFIFPILFFSIINGPIYNHLGVLSGNSREMLSVPMQQIANVVVYDSDSLSKETKQEINTFIPYDKITGLYNPRFADPIKSEFNTVAYDQNPMSFYKLWLKLFLLFPDNYISAFLSLNLPYWYPDACSIDSFSQRQYIETGIYGSDFYTFERQSKLPTLLSFYEKVANYDAFKNIPILSNIFSISTPIWVMLCSLFVVLLKKKKEGIIILALPLLFWLTYLAGPVSNLRYVFPLFVLYPLFFVLILDTDSVLRNQEI